MSLLQLGCDVARFGDDATVIHVRLDDVSLHHESYRKRDTVYTAGRLRELCREFAPQAGVSPWRVPCLIDDTGVGGGVVDQRHEPPTLEDLAAREPGGMTGRDYWFVPVNAGQRAMDPEKYPNARSECLFLLAERFAERRLDLSRLPRPIQDDLRRQALQITYKLDAGGRRVVERKDITKDRIGRSPDDLDGTSLAYYGIIFVPSMPHEISLDRNRYADNGGRPVSPRSPYDRESRRRTFG